MLVEDDMCNGARSHRSSLYNSIAAGFAIEESTDQDNWVDLMAEVVERCRTNSHEARKYIPERRLR